MNFEILYKLPKNLFSDLPLNVQLHLDAYLSDRQSMLNLSQDFIDSKLLPRTYHPTLSKMKNRMQESLEELKNSVKINIPDFNLKQRLSDIFINLNTKS